MNSASDKSKWFDGRKTLNRRFVIYLPSKTQSGKPVSDFSGLRHGIASMLGRRFGGATAYPATGYFGAAEESITVIECFCDDPSWSEASEYLLSLLKAIGVHCDQEAVACSLDGEMLLVQPGGSDDVTASDERQRLLDELMAAGRRP